VRGSDSVARRRRSPGRPRDGDDNGAPPVSGTGRGGGLARLAGPERLLGRLGLLGWKASARARAGPRGAGCCCVQLGWANKRLRGRG
jgi:hypothetical protein